MWDLAHGHYHYHLPKDFALQVQGTGCGYLEIPRRLTGGGLLHGLKSDRDLLCLCLLLALFFLYIHLQVYIHAHTTLYVVFCATLYTICCICIHCIHEYKRKKAHVEQAWGGPKLEVIFKFQHHPIPAMWVFLYYYTLPLTLQTRQTASSCPRLH